MTPRRFVLAEVDELATDQARTCSVCGQKVRFVPRQPGAVMRAAGRGWSDRCATCVLAPELVCSLLMKTRPLAEVRCQVRASQAKAVLAQVRDIEQCPRSLKRDQALEVLYLQLQQLAEELAAGTPQLRVIPGGRAPVHWSPAEHPMQ